MTMKRTAPLPETAKGTVAYNMTNDFLFHVVLEKDNYALKGLIASILHISPRSIKKVQVLNPILNGNTVEEKQFILDIYVLFNNNTYINLEMQVEDHQNWIPRSLSYLCREFDQLHHGDDYTEVKSVHHVGFLNFTLFDDHPEFHAMYRLRNVIDGYTYTDRFSLHVVELNNTGLATKEDKLYKTDKWAELFKATTWEEIKMLAQENDFLASAANSIYSNVTDPRILKLCMKRQEDIDGEENRRKRIKQQDIIIAEQDSKIAEQDSRIADQESKIAEQGSRIADQDSKIAEQDSKIAEQDSRIAEQESKIADQKSKLARYEALYGALPTEK